MAKSQKTIEVTIDKTGDVKTEASGFPGATCLKEVETLEAALGKVEQRSLKLEATKPVTIADKTTVGGK